jgi:hypothetical protein
MQNDENTQEHFFKGLFHVFNDSNLNYVVLHSWQTLPKSAISDVDMLISADEKKRLPRLLKEVESVTEWKFVQKLWYDVPWCFYYVAVSPDGKVSAALDFVSDPNGIGEYRIKDSQILPYREFSGFLYRLSTEAELAYKIAKRRVKGIFRDEDLEFVREYYRKCDVDVLTNRLEELLPKALVPQTLELLANDTSIEEYRRFMSLNTPAFVLFGRRWRIKLGVAWFYLTIKRVLYRLRWLSGCILHLKDSTFIDFCGMKFLQWNAVFPHFMFRKCMIASHGERITLWRKIKVLASATVLIIPGSDDNYIEIGNGKMRIQGKILDAVISSMQRRVRWS